MAQNTNNLEDYTVFSSVSLNGSGATLKAKDFSASRFTSTGTLIAQEVWASTVSSSKYTSAGTLISTEVWGSTTSSSKYTSAGTLISQEVWASLVSAPAINALSRITSAAFTVSGTTSNTSFIPANLPTGGFIFSVVSGTQNGATLAYNSGTTVYVFYSAVSAAQK